MRSESVSDRVSTRLLFENDRVRVWEMVLQPGEESTLHEHAADYVFVHLTSSRLAVFAEGQPPRTSDEPAGFVQYTDVGPGIVHKVRNVGLAEHREILVELKGPSRSEEPRAPETNEHDGAGQAEGLERQAAPGAPQRHNVDEWQRKQAPGPTEAGIPGDKRGPWRKPKRP